MISWRITKYNPIYRDEKGVYQKDEWTSCNDIGKAYEGKEFTIRDYMAGESAYVNAVISFMKNINVNTLTVQNIEKYNNIRKLNNMPLIYSDEMIKLYERVHENSILEIEDIQDLCRLALREQIWCKLQNDNKMFVHFGYDYNMYIGCSPKLRKDNLIEITGLFVEKFDSPYAEE